MATWKDYPKLVGNACIWLLQGSLHVHCRKLWEHWDKEVHRSRKMVKVEDRPAPHVLKMHSNLFCWPGVSTVFCKGPDRKYFPIYRPRVPLGGDHQVLRLHGTGNLRPYVNEWVQIKVYLWILKFEFHVS